MTLRRLLDERDVQKILDKNSALPFGRRNAALIMGVVYWGLTMYELSMLDVKDVVEEDGKLYKIWILPAHNSFNGEAREIRTEDHVAPFFEGWIRLRLKKRWGLRNISTYQGLDPHSKFFLNDGGQPYVPSNEKKLVWQFQSQTLTEHFRRMIWKAGIYNATPSDLRDSQINMMYENGCGVSELMKVSGIKKKTIIEDIIKPEREDIDDVYEKIFSEVKCPFANGFE